MEGSFQSLFQNCVLWWPGYNSTIFPVLPSGVTITSNGTFTNTILQNGKIIKNFDGATNSISLTDNDAWSLGSNDLSILGWIKFNSFPSVGYVIICSQYDSSNNWWFGFYKEGTITLYLQSSAGSISKSISLSTGIIYHIAIVRSGTSYYVYLDGQQLGDAITGAVTIPNSSGDLWIGEYAYFGTTYLFNGNLKDFMIFKNRALSLHEIRLIMDRTNPNKLLNFQPMKGYYK